VASSLIKRGKHLVARPEGTKIKIRLNTLAQQYGQKYDTEHVEFAVGISDFPPTEEQPNFVHQMLNVKITEGEWKRFEAARIKAHFSPRRQNALNRLAGRYEPSVLRNPLRPKSQLINSFLRLVQSPSPSSYRQDIVKQIYRNVKKHQYYERSFGNISYRRLQVIPGEITSITVPMSQLPLIEGTGAFYSGIVYDDGVTARISFLSVNDNTVMNAFGVDKLNKIPRTERDFLLHERKRELAKNEIVVKVARVPITKEQATALDEKQFPFRLYQKGDTITATICQADLQGFCEITGLEYKTELEKIKKKDNARAYAKLKKAATDSGDKLVYRVVDWRAVDLLSEGDFEFFYANKGNGKYNVAFLSKSEGRYEEILWGKQRNASLKS